MASPFKTPPNERSFSGLVDGVILQTGRAASLTSIVDYANLTIRECQAFGLFARDLLEEEFAVDAVPFVWQRPAYFRKLRTVKYVNNTLNTSESTVFPKFLLPGKQQKNEADYFYAADDYYAFKGCALGATIGMANYYWAKPLMYFARLGIVSDKFPAGPFLTRPAYFDIVDDRWMYLAGDTYATTTGDAAIDLAYQKLTSNWLVSEWYEMIASGTRAKILGGTGDDTRANREFASYKATQLTFRNSVGLEAEGF